MIFQTFQICQTLSENNVFSSFEKFPKIFLRSRLTNKNKWTTKINGQQKHTAKKLASFITGSLLQLWYRFVRVKNIGCFINCIRIYPSPFEQPEHYVDTNL